MSGIDALERNAVHVTWTFHPLLRFRTWQLTTEWTTPCSRRTEPRWWWDVSCTAHWTWSPSLEKRYWRPFSCDENKIIKKKFNRTVWVIVERSLCHFLQIDIHIMTQPPSGEWVYFSTELTNSSGRVSYVIPESQKLGIGVYPVKMVVRYAKSLLFHVNKNIDFTCASPPFTITSIFLFQGRPYSCRQLSLYCSTRNRVCCIQYWRVICCQCVYNGQRPKGSSWSCGCGEVRIIPRTLS